MKFKYGSYEHDDNEVSFTWNYSVIYDGFKRGRGNRVTVHIRGVKLGSSASDLTTKLYDLENGYSRNGGNMIFTDNDGAQTAHTVLNSNTHGGVRVMGFKYLQGNPNIWGSGTEYVNKRTFEIVLEADLLNVRGPLLEYHENVEILGTGGPRIIFMGALVGPEEPQITQQQTSVVALQSGYAVGDTTWPTPPNPLWPNFMLHETGKHRVKRGSPKYVPGSARGFPVEWYYTFQSSGPLNAAPTAIQV